MTYAKAYERLRGAVGGLIRVEESLARHTTYRIGGPAALYMECGTLSGVAATLEVLEEHGIEWTVLGGGSNVLVSDSGYDGAVIVLGREFKRHRIDGMHLTSGAGVSLASLVRTAYSRGLSGLEFAAGIPGTLGGALAMNAGSRSEWIGTLVESITYWAPGVGLRSAYGSEIQWGYRKSDIAARGVLLEATLFLREGDRDRMRRVTEARLAVRRATQPLGTFNAGSVFVNPEGDSAGRLIEACGLKGTRVGDAEVSMVHANFIINRGRARAEDVLALIAHVREVVARTYGIELEPEIRFLGAKS